MEYKFIQKEPKTQTLPFPGIIKPNVKEMTSNGITQFRSKEQPKALPKASQSVDTAVQSVSVATKASKKPKQEEDEPIVEMSSVVRMKGAKARKLL